MPRTDFGASAFALGIGALGSSYPDCQARFGEFLVGVALCVGESLVGVALCVGESLVGVALCFGEFLAAPPVVDGFDLVVELLNE